MRWFKRKNRGRPSANEVAERSLALRHVVVYALMTPPPDLFADTYASWSEQERSEYEREALVRRDEYWTRLKSLGLDRALSPWERAFAETTMATMSPRQLIDASWRSEALHVLMWALGAMPVLPPYDVMMDPDVLKDFPSSEPREFINRATLRPDDEIDQQRNNAEFWHWRSRTRQLQESGDRLTTTGEMLKIGINSFDDIVRMSARQAAADGTLPEIIDEDFVIFGEAYRNATPEEWGTVRSIAAERHYALNWLCGYAPGNEWDETPTDT